MPRNIVITGASSGIGLALAKDYAKAGNRLALIGRDPARLNEAASACRAHGAEAVIGAIDVRDRETMQAWLADFDAKHAVDLLIANAGILRGSPDGNSPETAEDSLAVFETNVGGVVNTVHPLLPRMIERRRGQIAIMSSIAGLTPLSWCPSYSASKAAAYAYGMSLRDALEPYNVSVSVICPGFVGTPMTKQLSGYRSQEIGVAEASSRIRSGLDAKEALIAFPAALAAGARLVDLMPGSLRKFFTRPLGVDPRRP